MKNTLFSLLAILSMTAAKAQQTNVPYGDYYGVESGLNFKLSIEKDDTFKMIMASGNLKQEDTIVRLKMDGIEIPVFGLSINKGKTPTDSITFHLNQTFKSYHTEQVYIGTQENKNDSIDYKKISNYVDYSLGFKSKLSNGIKIPKTKYIHLVEKKYNQEITERHSFEIPTNTSSVLLNYNPTPTKKLELYATYNPKLEEVTLLENGKADKPIVLYKDLERYLSKFEKPFEIEEETTLLNTTNPSFTKSDYTFKLNIPKTYKEALATITAQKKLLALIYLPEEKNAQLAFKNFITTYEKNTSSLMYDKYDRRLDQFQFYQIKNTDSKLKDKHKLNKGSIVIIDNTESAVYQRTIDLNNLTRLFTTQIYKLKGIDDLRISKNIDNLISASSFNKEQTQTLLNELTLKSSYTFYSGHKNITNKKYQEEEFKRDNASVYNLKAEPEDFDNLLNQLIKAHKNDESVDFEYANILEKQVTQNHFKAALYGETTYQYNLSLDGIDYLMAFEKELKEYKAILEEEQLKGYYFDNLYPHTLTQALYKLADVADAKEILEIKKRFNTIFQGKGAYLDFLKKYIPVEYLENYKIYFDRANLSNTKNIINALNDLYEDEQSNSSWKNYKSNVANNANNAAWTIVENNNKKFLKEAIQWSATSLIIAPENPYYLDTFAQLNYIKGNKKEAIKNQKKAITILEKDFKNANTSSIYEMKAVLRKMEDGTY